MKWHQLLELDNLYLLTLSRVILILFDVFPYAMPKNALLRLICCYEQVKKSSELLKELQTITSAEPITNNAALIAKTDKMLGKNYAYRNLMIFTINKIIQEIERNFNDSEANYTLLSYLQGDFTKKIVHVETVVDRLIMSFSLDGLIPEELEKQFSDDQNNDDLHGKIIQELQKNLQQHRVTIQGVFLLYRLPLLQEKVYDVVQMKQVLRQRFMDVADLDIVEPLLLCEWNGDVAVHEMLCKLKIDRIGELAKRILPAKKVIMPILCNHNRWVALYFVFERSLVSRPDVYYFDPRGKEIIQNVIAPLEQGEHFDIKRMVFAMPNLQHIENSSSPFFVEALYAFITHQTHFGEDFNIEQVTNQQQNLLRRAAPAIKVLKSYEQFKAFNKLFLEWSPFLGFSFSFSKALEQYSLDPFLQLLGTVGPSLVTKALEQWFSSIHEIIDAVTSIKYQYLLELFGPSLDGVLLLQRRLLFLSEWNHLLQYHGQKIIDQQLTSKLKKALMVKELIYSKKSQFYLISFTKDRRTMSKAFACLEHSIQETLRQFGVIDQKNYLENLVKRCHELTTEINAKEKSLLNCSLPMHLGSAILRMMTQNGYFQLSYGLVASLYELSAAKMAQYPSVILARRSQPEFLNGAAALLAASWFSVDLYGSKRFALLTYPLVHAFVHPLLLNALTLDRITKILHGNEDIAINCLDALYWMVGLTVHLFLYGWLFSYERSTLAYFMVDYVIATSLRATVGLLLDSCSTTKNPLLQSENNMPYIFMRGLAAQAGYIGGSYFWRRSFPYLVAPSIRPKADMTLLENTRECLAEKERCRLLALKKLDLPKDVNWHSIRNRWKEVSRKYHPDKSPSGASQYILFALAYKRLEDLRRQTMSSAYDHTAKQTGSALLSHNRS